VFDVHSLYAHLLGVVDRRGRRYTLALILLLVVLAKLGGEDKPNGIAARVRARKAFLIKAFDLCRTQMPCANTYRAVLSEGVAAAEQGLHLLAAYLLGRGLVLMQVAVDGRENEITAAPRVLEMLDLQRKIVTGDALLAQRELSKQIVAAGGDYLWTVKDNQPQLRADSQHPFEPDVQLTKGFNTGPTDFHTARTVTTGHGRIETRTLTASSLLNPSSDWPGLGQVFKLERETRLLARGLIRREVV
jgi:hypothetical protein